MNESVNFLDSIIDLSNLKEFDSIDRIINSLKGHFIFIYGAGGFGREMYNLLSKYGIKVSAFLDKAASDNEQIFDVPVYRADERYIDSTTKKEAVVLLSIVARTDIIHGITEFIKTCGFDNVIDSQSIRAQLIYPDDCDNKIIGIDYYLQNKDKINRVARIWSDEESLSLYKSNLIAHITRNYDSCAKSSREAQYFPKNIMFSKGYSRFVDCGGYIGDTLEELVKCRGDIEAIVSFEPDSDNFVKLSDAADKLKSRIKQTTLFPLALSNKSETLSFHGSIGSGQISTKGDEFVQCVALDDSIKSFSPTFIKMDVEGMELKALEGSKKVICESRPDLAICVYHCINHIWDIPILLDDWGVGYKFYLRMYSSCTMETVLYATCNK